MGGLDVIVSIQNAGKFPAIETPQLYVAWPGRVAMRPKKSLRGFARVNLAPGESRRVNFRIEPIDLAWFDCETHSWRIEKGIHGVIVGRSSRDLAALSAAIEFEMEVDLGV
ncbi:MAG: hypothetical protein B7Z22_08420 [Hyphomonas sp. 32-62-5]|nr:MAG: hypothetical protein B7Z22_08420 [Hyphomonas sp. 32-62-5]